MFLQLNGYAYIMEISIHPNLVDLEGKKFGRLIVLGRYHGKNPRITYWQCKCECGNIKPVQARFLKTGQILSCGCYCLEVNSNRLKGNAYGFKHGYHEHPLRAIRKAMIHRCTKPKNPYFQSYGARGISVCKEWMDSLEEFISWSLSAGWVKGLSIDRKDNNGDYTPENCHWITIAENSRKNAIRLWKEGIWRKK